MPSAYVQRLYFALKIFEDYVELGLEELGVLLHVRQGGCPILQKQRMAQLVYLIEADGLGGYQLLHVRHIRLAARKARNTASWEGYLGRGSEFKYHIRIAGLAAQRQNIPEGAEFSVKLVDTVGVVPHEQEVRRRRLKMRYAVDDLVAVYYAVGIGILRHAPHTLYGGILYDLLYHVHVRAVVVHGNRYKLHAEGLGDLEVAVIAGRRAKPLYLVQLGPWFFGMQQAVGISLCYGIVHKLKAGVAAYKYLLGLYSQSIGKKSPAYRQTVQPAVIKGVYAVCNSVGYNVDIKHIV